MDDESDGEQNLGRDLSTGAREREHPCGGAGQPQEHQEQTCA